MLSTILRQKDRENQKNRSLIEELNDAVKAGTAQQRNRIVERIADLFAAGSRGYSSEQITLFDDILQELAADIESQTRARLAHRLAGIANAPPRLVRLLAFDDQIEVAEPVLIRSQCLSESDLIENARTKSQSHLFAIAQRLKLSEAVTDVLVERGDCRVLRKVVTNKGARFSLAGYGKLTIRARHDNKLTLALGHREDLPRQYFLKLLEAASASVRVKLERVDPAAAATIGHNITVVATAMQQEARKASSHYGAAARDGRRLVKLRPFTEGHVHARAHAQEFDRTVVALSKLGRFPVDLVERALVDKGQEIILVLAKAAGCSWTTVKELLTMSVAERKIRADDLALAFDRYKKLSQATACKAMSFYERRMKLEAKRNA